MPTLLHIDSSPSTTSVTRELTREFVETWKAAHPDGNVIYRDLAANQIDEVLLVGGSTRIPRIQAIVKELFNKEPNKTVNRADSRDTARRTRSTGARNLHLRPSERAELLQTLFLLLLA